MSFKDILNDEDVREILSKSLYWDELARRENAGQILEHHLMNQLSNEVGRLGPKILWILKEAALQVRKGN